MWQKKFWFLSDLYSKFMFRLMIYQIYSFYKPKTELPTECVRVTINLNFYCFRSPLCRCSRLTGWRAWMVTRNRRSGARNTMGGVQEEEEMSLRKVWIWLAALNKVFKIYQFRKKQGFLVKCLLKRSTCRTY